MSVARRNDGWYDFTPDVDSRIIYVSNSLGNDSNNGLSSGTPVKTIASGYALLRAGYPDYLLFKCGDTWNNENFDNWDKYGRSINEPMVVSSYGDGDRPFFNTGSGNFLTCANNSSPRSYLAFSGLHASAEDWTGYGTENPAGLWLLLYGTGYHIENCKIENYTNNLLVQGSYGTVNDLIHNVIINRNVVVDPKRTDGVGHTNMFFASLSNLNILENTVISRISNSFTQLSEGLYISDSVERGTCICSGNIVYNCRTNIADRAGGKMLNNLSVRGGQCLYFGYNAEGYHTISVDCIGNVITETRDHWNGQPLGIGLGLFGLDSYDTSYNIITHNTSGTSPQALLFDQFGSSGHFHHNIVYDWGGSPNEDPLILILTVQHSGVLYMHDNIFKHPESNGKTMYWLVSATGIPDWLVVNNNVYHYSNPAFAYTPGNYANNMTFTQWQNSKEPSARNEYLRRSVDVPTVGKYYQTLGGQNDTDSFMGACTSQERNNWNPRFRAQNVNDYFRAKFGMVLPRSLSPIQNVQRLGKIRISENTVNSGIGV